MTDNLFADLSASRLQWLPEAGVGFFECVGAPYDAAYFANYRGLAETPVGAALNAFRVALLREHMGDPDGVLDVGIGDGAFVRAAVSDGATGVAGFDVNPAGIEWLNAEGRFGELYRPEGWDLATFWDSLEHIRDPRPALAAVRRVALVSIPTFRDVSHVMASKHYKRDEHYWYFTRPGFVAFAKDQGFSVVDIRATETAIGREDIETFVLVRDSGHSPADEPLRATA